jgi:hypothetical protein
MDRARVSRRELLAAAAAAGTAAALHAPARARAKDFSASLEFGSLGPGEGWPGWRCTGVANLRRADGRGLLEAGSDVFPCDPRPVAFAVDRRFQDGEVAAVVAAGGTGAGVVLRRTGPRDYYAAVYDDEQRALLIVRRSADDLVELARVAADLAPPFRLSLSASGRDPTALAARVEPGSGQPVAASARDAAPAVQRAGDPGVLATARTLFPSEGAGPAPALGNLHLLPYGVQEGQAVLGTAVGRQVLDRIRERSTAVFEEIAVRASGSPGTTRPSVVAATTGAPVSGGARLRVAADVPARVEIELAADPAFRRSRRRVRVGRTDSLDAAIARVGGLRPGHTAYWRARLRRAGREAVGPVRSFRVLPRAGSGKRAAVAIASCASQFGPAFDQLAARRPDAFVWQGDLNYPDTLGPLAQSVSGYAGIWRDFMANPRLAPILERAAFAAQRDDHDYGVQDANSTNLVPWGLTPWESLVEGRHHYRFAAGVAEYWVLDQRRFKSDPAGDDTPGKSLLGLAQRAWLMSTLAASRAPFKVICSPCTLAPLRANARDGSWATGYTAERDLLLDHIARNVSGRTLFVTGDTHWTMVYDRDGLFEARPCPVGIPTPNDITLTQPQAAAEARGAPGVAYADDASGHFALLESRGEGGTARVDLTLVREDGATAFQAHFEQPLA